MPVAADDPRLARCGFAKLSGDGGKLDVVLRKYAVLLGRPSKGKDVDVPLEGHKAVSREHAWIRYNFATSEWHGRGGVDSCFVLLLAPAAAGCNVLLLQHRPCSLACAAACMRAPCPQCTCCPPTGANRRGCLRQVPCTPNELPLPPRLLGPSCCRAV